MIGKDGQDVRPNFYLEKITKKFVINNYFIWLINQLRTFKTTPEIFHFVLISKAK